MSIFIIRSLQYLNEIFFSLYAFVSPKKYDIYFAVFMFFMSIHWVFLKDECILSYLEKKLMDPNYELGSDPKKHVYREYLYPVVVYAIDLLYLINLYIVYNRNDSIYIKSLLLVSLVIILYYRAIYKPQ